MAAIYFQLPYRHKHEWLKFDKVAFADKWTALMAFLEDIYDTAVQEKLLIASYTPLPRDGGDKKVGQAGMYASKVEDEDVTSGDESDETASKIQQRKRFEEKRQKVGKCPVCKEEHTYKTRWNPMPWPADRFLTCKKFNDMSSKLRAEAIEKAAGCARCTSWTHNKSECNTVVSDCQEMVNGARCHKDHSRLVCNSGVAYCLAARTMSEISSQNIDIFQPTLHYIQDIPTNGASARVIWDDGSNRVLVNNSFARENNLRSRDTTVTMKVVGGQKKTRAKIYELDLLDMYGVKHGIWGYGIEEIIDPDEPVDLGPVRTLFPHVPDQAFALMPKKRIDILVGLNFNYLHPSGGLGVDAVGNLKALRNRFGSGWVIGGCHAKLKTAPLRVSAQAATARLARVTVVPDIEVTEIEVDPSGIDPTFAKIQVDQTLTPDFWESDSMGVLPPRKCAKCRQCAEKGDCSEAHYLLTMKEEAELKLISDKVTVENGEVHVEYPFIKNPSCLPNNRKVAVKIADKLWSSLERDNLLLAYHEEIKKYIERGTFVKLSKDEIDSYQGPHQYITHHGVLKESVSTPLRVVTNSSFNNCGNSLNSCLPKGPNSLNDMFAITLRFRCHVQAFMFDLAKAYNTMRTGLVERHLRRFVWRWSEDEEWQDYAIDRVHFGDISAACQLEVSKVKVADLGTDIDFEAVEKIKRDTYVDDGASGGKKRDVQRMVGNRDEDGNYDGTI